MWIRSQDKTELINTNRIQVDRNIVFTFSNINEESGWIQLGEYETREKAIEVLDKIQAFIIDYEFFKGDNEDGKSNAFTCVVFGMPAEEANSDGVN